MPVTKFTLDYPRIKSFHRMPVGYDESGFEAGIKEAKDMSETYKNIHAIITYLKAYPDADIEVVIKMVCGEDQKITVTQKNKRHTIYWIPFLYIHVTTD